MLSSALYSNDNWHNSNNLHHNTEDKGLNPFDVTGAISLRTQKITSIEPSRFSQLFHQCGFTVSFPSRQAECCA